MYKPHTFCRACGYGKTSSPAHIKAEAPTEKLTEVFDLGIQPLANDFRRQGEECSGYAPLKVLFCPRCTLGQLSVTVRPDILYRKYSYVTSTSDTMREHFNALLQTINSISSGNHLLEIGSNDGALLSFFRDRGYQVLGVDPAENLCEAARTRGVDTLCGLWGEGEDVPEVRRRMVPDVVLARHVFCHADNWRGFIENLDQVCGPKTVVCLEVPHAQKLLENCEFDTIYHEHLSYLTLRSVDALLKDSPFQLDQIEHYPIHGGALLLMLVRKESVSYTLDPVKRALESEKAGAEEWKAFQTKATWTRNALCEKVCELRSQGKTVCGLGASAKSTVWMNACGFTRKDIMFIADTTPQKWYTTSPGSDIPVVDEGAILRDLPDYTVMFCWNFKDEVLRRNELYISKGGKFIVPVPRLEVI